METEQGRVVELKDGQVVIELQAGLHCMTCASRGACQALGGGARRIILPSRGSIRPGQQVTLRYPARNRVLAATLIFLLPLAGLIGGYAVAVSLSPSQGVAVAGAFLGLVLGFVALRLLDRLLTRRGTVDLPELLDG